jgi:hypothetical protein
MALIESALAGQHNPSTIPESDVIETVALVEYTVDQFRLWQTSPLDSASRNKDRG